MRWSGLYATINFTGWFIHEIDGSYEYVARIKSVRVDQDFTTVEQDRLFVRRVGLKTGGGLSVDGGEWEARPVSGQGWPRSTAVFPIYDNSANGYEISRGQFGSFLLFPPDRYSELVELFTSPRSVFEGKVVEEVSVEDGKIIIKLDATAACLIQPADIYGLLGPQLKETVISFFRSSKRC